MEQTQSIGYETNEEKREKEGDRYSGSQIGCDYAQDVDYAKAI